MYLSTNEMERRVLEAAMLQYEVGENLQSFMDPVVADTFADCHGDFTADQFRFAAGTLYYRAMLSQHSTNDLMAWVENIAERKYDKIWFVGPDCSEDDRDLLMAVLLWLIFERGDLKISLERKDGRLRIARMQWRRTVEEELVD